MPQVNIQTAAIGMAALLLCGAPVAGCGSGGDSVANGSGTGDDTDAQNPDGLGPALVKLGTAGDFVVLAKSGIDTIPQSAITGDIGVSPIDQTGLTGFSEVLDSTGSFATAGQVTGKLYAADYAVPTPTKMTTAVSDMETAYTDAAGRTAPDFAELAAGDISGLTLEPGLYKWGTGVVISSDLTLSGATDDVWIFQIGEGLTQASGTKIVLAQTGISLATGASINGRLLAQAAVTLDGATVTQPHP